MPDDEENPTLVTRVLTCHTEGCGNADEGISVDVPEDVGAYSCGVCGQPITDIA